MRLTALSALFALSALTGCKDKSTPTPTPAATHRPVIIATLPVYPGSRETDTTGSDEVERRSWLLQRPMDAVTAFYRDTMPKLGWRMMSDEGDQTKRDFYLTKDTLNFWVHIEALGVLASKYEMIAGRADTTTSGHPVMARPR